MQVPDVEAVLDGALSELKDHLHPEYRAARALPTLAEAYRMMHRPADDEEPVRGRRRLALDELLLLQLAKCQWFWVLVGQEYYFMRPLVMVLKAISIAKEHLLFQTRLDNVLPVKPALCWIVEIFKD